MKRFLLLIVIAACGSPAKNSPDAGAPDARTMCPAGAGQAVGHVIVVVQENHTFDNYFGNWCTAAPGSNPTCTSGPSCCEAGPAMDPSGASPIVLDDAEHASWTPDHTQACELAEIDDGKMDGFVTGPGCASAQNFAYAPASLVGPYQDLAAANAIADRYFQPIVGQSESNNMYLAVAKEVFIDNAFEPNSPGSVCEFQPTTSYPGQTTLADLLMTAGRTVTWYAEGWDAMVAAGPTSCPLPPVDCPAGIRSDPCDFDPGDVPFLYYEQFSDGKTIMRDYAQLASDLAGGTLPDVSFVKGLEYHDEHPGFGTTITDGVTFTTSLIQAVESSCYADSTLILLTWDEGGGYFDHVAPPASSTADNQPYGTRVPLLAIGKFASAGTVSHVQLEHSSIVKFLEWNYLGGQTGQLGARDALVNNLGSLLDPTKTAVTVPEN